MPAEAPLLYEDVATHVASLIERGALRAGDRLPSVRRFARERDVSIATVLAAYRQLENRELIETRPKSGHFVRARSLLAAPRRSPKPIAPAPAKVTVSD